jgi:hypothetical protein
MSRTAGAVSFRTMRRGSSHCESAFFPKRPTNFGSIVRLCGNAGKVFENVSLVY